MAPQGDARVTNWTTWTANAKVREDASRAGAENWAHFAKHEAESKGDRLARSQVARMALSRVMYENRIDVFVHPENTVPPPKIQGPLVGSDSLNGITPFFQIPRIVVPAGMTTVVYEPQYALSPDKRTYISVIATGTPKSTLAHPMPMALTFFSGQGEEPALIKVGTAYESATHYRRPPTGFRPCGEWAMTEGWSGCRSQRRRRILPGRTVATDGRKRPRLRQRRATGPMTESAGARVPTRRRHCGRRV